MTWQAGGGGGGMNNDFSQSTKFAEVARADFDMQNRRFGLPQMRTQKVAATTPVLMNENVDMARDRTNRNFATAKQTAGLDLSRYGVTPAANDAAYQDRTLDLAKSSAMARNVNAARQNTFDMQSGILTGGLGSVKLPAIAK